MIQQSCTLPKLSKLLTKFTIINYNLHNYVILLHIFSIHFGDGVGVGDSDGDGDMVVILC